MPNAQYPYINWRTIFSLGERDWHLHTLWTLFCRHQNHPSWPHKKRNLSTLRVSRVWWTCLWRQPALAEVGTKDAMKSEQALFSMTGLKLFNEPLTVENMVLNQKKRSWTTPTPTVWFSNQTSEGTSSHGKVIKHRPINRCPLVNLHGKKWTSIISSIDIQRMSLPKAGWQSILVVYCSKVPCKYQTRF